MYFEILFLFEDLQVVDDGRMPSVGVGSTRKRFMALTCSASCVSIIYGKLSDHPPQDIHTTQKFLEVFYILWVQMAVYYFSQRNCFLSQYCLYFKQCCSLDGSINLLIEG